MQKLLIFIFILAVIIQIFYYLFLFSKFAFAKKKSIVNSKLPVSVIIAAHDEAENLKEFLPKILAQNHPKFEVIIINDASSDNTEEVIKSFQKENIKIINIPVTDYYSGNKKNAISNGIAAAQYENLLFTDADCYPTSENWILEMTSHFQEKEIVLGYGAYQKLPTILNKLIRYETLLTAIQYFSYAKAKIPYMAVGRNMAYKKELFLNSNGFEKHKHIKSGDDDLFINEIATKQNTEICFSKDSFTISRSKETFLSWFRQKRRHISTANSYKPIHQFLLGLFYFSQLAFWVLAILLLAFSFNWQLVTILVAIRLILQYIVIYKSSLKLNEKDLIILSPILDLVLVIFQFGLFFSNILYKPKHW